MSQTLNSLLGELVGAASMCWDTPPMGVFQTEDAIQLVVKYEKDIKDRMLELIGEDMRPLSFSNKDFIDGKNNEKGILRQRIEEL